MKYQDKKEIEKIAKDIVEIISNKKGESISLLDLEGVNPLADYFILATVMSVPQSKAIAEDVRAYFKSLKIKRLSEPIFDPEIKWVLLDYSYIVIHVFTEEGREYYNLDKLLDDCKRVEIK